MSADITMLTKSPSGQVKERKPAGQTVGSPFGSPLGQKRLLEAMDREANKALFYLSWSTDMMCSTMMNVCANLCEAHHLFTSYEVVKVMFCKLSSSITNDWEETLFSDDWASFHRHSFSSGCKFLYSASNLLRVLVFESQMQSAINDQVPCPPELKSLSTMAPKLYQLFRVASCRAHFETINLDRIVAPAFSIEYKRLIGKLYQGEDIKARLIDAVHVAIRLYSALMVYPEIRFRYDALSSDMVLDMHTLRQPIGKAWKVILPAVTIMDAVGGEVALVPAMVFNDSFACQGCPRSWVDKNL